MFLGDNMNKKKIMKLLKSIYPYLIVIIVVILIRTFIITPAMVDGDSMLPTLKNNNIVLLNKFNYKLSGLKRFDIVVINHNGTRLIKRVVAFPGEHVEYKDNNLYIDGFVINEPFIHGKTNDFKLESIGYLKIPGDMYFVVGDNRDNSLDSRTIGLINKDEILGKVHVRIFPLTKVGQVK